MGQELLAVLGGMDAEVVAVELAPALGEGRPHGAVAVGAVENAPKQRRRLGSRLRRPRPVVACQDCMRLFPQVEGHDGVVLAGEAFSFVGDLADVEGIVEDAVDVAPCSRGGRRGAFPPSWSRTWWRAPAAFSSCASSVVEPVWMKRAKTLADKLGLLFG